MTSTLIDDVPNREDIIWGVTEPKTGDATATSLAYYRDDLEHPALVEFYGVVTATNMKVPPVMAPPRTPWHELYAQVIPLREQTLHDIRRLLELCSYPIERESH